MDSGTNNGTGKYASPVRFTKPGTLYGALGSCKRQTLILKDML